MKRDFDTDINYQYLLLLFFVTNFIVRRQIDIFIQYWLARFSSMLFLPVDSQQLHNNFPRIGDWQRIKNLI